MFSICYCIESRQNKISISEIMVALLSFKKIGNILWAYIKHLMTGPKGNSEFCFPRISMRFEGNKIHCSPRDRPLSDLLYSKAKQKQNLKTTLRFQRSRATAVNISRVTVNSFPFDVIVFRNVARSWHLAGNSFIVRCHVTMY